MADNKGLRSIEQKYGLPHLQDIVQLLSGEQASMLKDILTRAEKLSKQQQMLKDATAFINLVLELDNRGTLDKLNETLIRIEPLIKDKTIIYKLLTHLDKLEKVLREFSKPEPDEDKE